VCTALLVESAGANVLRALGEPPRDRKKVKGIKHDGNITLDQVKEIAKVMQERSKSKLFKGTVKEILGTCVSIGCTVDKKDPKALQKMIDAGEVAIDE
jgi:large subunit ribosomal protein L12e